MKFPASLVAMALAALSVVPSSTPAAAQRQVVTETITCQSVGNQRNECRVRGRIQDVQPVASFTNAPCIFGSTWGFDRRNIWVDRGCYAEFSVEVSRRADNSETQQSSTNGSAQRETITETVDCRSRNFRRQECKVEGKIQNVEKVGTFSAFRCNLGTSWGSEDRLIWVDRGCAARFNVTFTRRTTPNTPTPAPAPTETVTATPAPADTTARPFGDRNMQAVIAQGSCTGLFSGIGSSGKSAMIFAVPRTCSNSTPDCRAVCANAASTITQPNFRSFVSTRSLSCFNSVHVYDRGRSTQNETVGTGSVVFNSCEGGCGPNFCCCSAQ